MNERTRTCLVDIEVAGKAIRAFTELLSLESFSTDDRTRSAVERKFEIIGEALRRVRDEEPEVSQAIRFGPDIIGMRNRLIHGYDAVDEEIVWETIDLHLPELLADVDSLGAH